MKKVLIISYYFPPSGGPGVQRVLKFVKYLPHFGWEPIVLTVQDGDFPARDETLLKEIPQNANVHRTKIFEPYNLYKRITGRKKEAAIDVNNIHKEGKRTLSEKFTEFVRATFFIPDGRRGWLKYALKEGKRIIDIDSPDAIFSSSPPYTCALIAMDLKAYAQKKLNKNIPWISDFRDPWTGHRNTPKRWFLPSMIDKRYEKKTLKNADIIVTVANGIKDNFDIKYPRISKDKKYLLIRNGFDEDDFKGLVAEDKKNDKFTIVYTGSMYGKLNPYFFIDTISDLCDREEIKKDKIKMNFVGRFGNEILEYINKSKMKDSIELFPYVPHAESIKLLLKADAMLLIIDEDINSNMILTGKLFEYLAASLITSKPILAIAPEGEAADLIKETNAGFVIPHNDKELLSQTIISLYNSIYAKSAKHQANKEEINKYSRKLLTQKLSETLNNLSDN